MSLWLPHDVLFHIYGFLTYYEQQKCRLVCKIWLAALQRRPIPLPPDTGPPTDWKMQVPSELFQAYHSRLCHFWQFARDGRPGTTGHSMGTHNCHTKCICFQEVCRRMSLWRKLRRRMLRRKLYFLCMKR